MNLNHDKSDQKLIRATEQGVFSFLTEVAKDSDAILTGVAGTDKLQLYMIPGRLWQAARNKSFLHQLVQEINILKEKGKIREDYLETEQANATLQELLAAFDNPPMDETKFKALKAIFLKAASETLTSRDDSTPQFLMEIAKELTSAEILLLSAIHKVGKNKVPTKIQENAQEWLQYMIQNSQLKTTGLVELTETKLIEKKLISDREHSDRSGIKRGCHFRLTDLGLALCKFFADDEPVE